MSTAPAAAPLSRPAADVCQDVALSDDARALLAKKPTIAQFIASLSEKGLFADACRTLAFALPKREVIWWACQCVRQANATGGAKGIAALDAAERWVAGPDEKLRRAAHSASEAAGPTPAGCAALAVFLSGGSMGPPDIAEIPPPEDLTAKAACGAILLSAVIAEPAKANEKFKKFLALGQEIASGKSKWSVK